jgi:lipopolysaccharide/colanic/teichoic acid biosynthesis glycosyltransferase
MSDLESPGPIEAAPQASCASRGGASDAVRRLADVVVSLVLLVVLLPLMAVLSALVRLSSPGPALFRQERVGLNGQPFQLLKFRSMRVGDAGPAVTAGGDRRITPIGAFMRDWKLDELPQLVNVLLGHMALVGPRPEVPHYVRYYTREQREVLSVRPGVTGKTQLEYRHEERLLAGRQDVEATYIGEIMPAKLALDLSYVRSRTLMGDLGLLLRTVVAIVKSDDGTGGTGAGPDGKGVRC